jgi:hypothetical protein
MLSLILLSVVACPFGLCGTGGGQPAERITADVVITRLATDQWRVDYTFDIPVSGITYGPPVARFREQAWHVNTPEVRLVMREGLEALVTSDGPRSSFSILVERYTEYAPDYYAPLIPYSDGGAALFIGFFAGDAVVNGRETPVDFRFRFEGLPSEHVLPPGEQRTDAYVYFGPQEPIVSDHARLVLDRGTPEWLRDSFVRVTGSATRIFSERLGGLPLTPLVLVGAAEIDGSDGVSVKGGAVGGQLVMLLRGRGLREESERNRAMFERLTAHELAHLWQLHSFPAAFNSGEPWLHEGAAEAMAVHALSVSGAWEPSAVGAFAAQTAERCERTLGQSELPEAARGGNWEAVYACGFGIFWTAGMDPLTIWSNFVEAVNGEGHPYTQATLERVLAGSR